MRILHIGCTVGFEIQNPIPSENHRLRSVNIHQRVPHSTNTHEVSDFTFLLHAQLRRTFRHLFESSFNRFVQNFIKSNVVSSTTRHLVAWKSNKVVSEVNKVIGLSVATQSV